MKYLLLLFLLIFNTLLYSQLPSFLKDMVAIDSTLFAGKYEISNNDWREYHDYLGKKYGIHAQIFLENEPDANVWWKDYQYSYGEPILENYYWHPAFDNYPVVGVSYEMVEKYIAWRNEILAKQLKKIGEKRHFIYRLPSKAEWEIIAIKELYMKCLPRMRRKYKMTKKNAVYFNFESTNDPYYQTSPVDAFCPNVLELYNIRGNVAEMLQEKGVAKGGSFIHTEIESPISQDFSYHSPEKWLGFRLVLAEIK